MKAMTTMLRELLRDRSQFFQRRRHLSSQAKERSTTTDMSEQTLLNHDTVSAIT